MNRVTAIDISPNLQVARITIDGHYTFDVAAANLSSATIETCLKAVADVTATVAALRTQYITAHVIPFVSPQRPGAL